MVHFCEATVIFFWAINKFQRQGVNSLAILVVAAMHNFHMARGCWTEFNCFKQGISGPLISIACQVKTYKSLTYFSNASLLALYKYSNQHGGLAEDAIVTYFCLGQTPNFSLDEPNLVS